MIYVSMIELFSESKISLISIFGEFYGYLYTILAFFAGILIILIIDKLIPKEKNPHEIKSVNEIDKIEKEIETNKHKSNNMKNLYRMGIFTAFVLSLHNFPEGIAVSVPIYFATGNKKKAFLYSFLSGLAEPLGAIVGFIVLGTILNELAFGIIFAMIAGIMVYISLDELLPAAREYGEHHFSIYELVFGMFVMAISLLLL